MCNPTTAASVTMPEVVTTPLVPPASRSTRMCFPARRCFRGRVKIQGRARLANRVRTKCAAASATAYCATRRRGSSLLVCFASLQATFHRQRVGVLAGSVLRQARGGVSAEQCAVVMRAASLVPTSTTTEEETVTRMRISILEAHASRPTSRQVAFGCAPATCDSGNRRSSLNRARSDSMRCTGELAKGVGRARVRGGLFQLEGDAPAGERRRATKPRGPTSELQTRRSASPALTSPRSLRPCVVVDA